MKTLLISLTIICSVNLNAQNVNIPDVNFKAYLVGNTAINTNADTEIQVAEATAFTGTIDCSWLFITDLTGIEAFSALTVLHCFSNNLMSFDVSMNTTLTDLRCENNQLTSLNVSTNTSLANLRCENNQLTSLDVSTNTALTFLACIDNLLTSLDVSQNINLDWLSCSSNQLTSLDISGAVVLTNLFCWDNQLASLDVTQNTLLTDLNCSGNNLTSLDVSQNSALDYLNCNGNLLTLLDVSMTAALTALNCSNNSLEAIDVSQNPALDYLNCGFNQLECLNVKNGNNTNMGYLNFFADSNSNLICIEVDDVAWSTSTWSQIDIQSSFSENCGNDCSSSVGLNVISTTSKELLKVVDQMGREVEPKSNNSYIYIYSDGSVERVFKLED